MLAMILLQSGTTSIVPNLIFISGILLVFYFFMILPQQRKQKEFKKFKDNLKVGDNVVTIGGLHGKIHELNENTVTLLVDKSTRLVFDKNSISVDASKRLSEGN